jgi:Raf kinase inhibitor-like YbhB/YbcL family protein
MRSSERIRRWRPFGAAVGVWLLVAWSLGCRGTSTLAQGKPTLNLTSTSFQGDEIPRKFSCDDADIAPQLAWTAPPAATKSFALIVNDRDAPLGSFVHWVLYDLPPEARELPEGLPKQGQLADGSRQGQNDFDKIGYGGPCPPKGSTHRYVFTLYALDAKLNLPAGATRSAVESALKAHILAYGELVGRYKR